jgi:hypothetical protein
MQSWLTYPACATGNVLTGAYRMYRTQLRTGVEATRRGNQDRHRVDASYLEPDDRL